MRPLLIIALAALLPAANGAAASTFEKGDRPCISGLCIGDGLEELAPLKWKRAKNPIDVGRPEYVGERPLDAYRKKEIQEIFRGKIDAAAPYLAIHSFDGKAFPMLRQVKAACRRAELSGVFESSTGASVHVTIALVPNENDVLNQRWQVTQLSRSYPEAISLTQAAQVRSELETRYARYHLAGPRSGVKGYFAMSHGATVGFVLRIMPNPREFEQLKLHPLCGGATRISID